jgi:conjugal transfer mating pair stabilization protein TraN
MFKDNATGKCFNYRYTYACSDPDSFSIINSHERNICDSDIACAGGQCNVSEVETNDDFVNAMAQFSMAQSIGADSMCKDPNDPSTCTIWPGEYEYCSFFPVGNDCCEGPAGVSIYDYVSVISSMGNLDSQIMGAEFFAETAVKDGWEAMRTPIVNGYDAVSQPLTTAWNSLSGNITGEAMTEAGTAVGEASSTLGLESIKQEMTNYVADLMPDALKDVLFTESENVAGEYAMSKGLAEATNMISGVMAIYTAYQMANLVIQIATQCDDNEIDAGLKIEMKQCIKVNNTLNNNYDNDSSTCEKKVFGVCVKKRHHYCCYSTPLARIVIEQAIPQLNKMLEVNTDEMSCAGLSFTDIQAIDWSQINMDEWIGLMAGSGMLPLSDDETSENNMTGSGQLMNVHGRMSTTDRMEGRLTDDELGQRQEEIWNSISINNIDCPSNPTLPVCKYRKQNN